MANSILTAGVIAKEALMQLENNMVMGNLVHRDYAEEFSKVGDTVSIRRPVRFAVTDGAALTKQDVVEGKTTITVDKQKHVGWEFDSKTLTLSIDEYSERYIKPAMIQLANTVDADCAALYKDVPSWVGTPGQVVNSFADFAKAPERLDLNAVPMDARAAVLSPTDFWGMLGAQTALYITDTAKDAYRRAKLGLIGGVDTNMSQNVVTHTVGALGGTPLVMGAGQTSTYASVKDTMTQTLAVDGWTASVTGVLKQGDVLTIAGVYAVNPVSKATLPFLQPFVVTADASSNGSGQTSLTVYPAIITSGAYQTVSAAPADNAAVTVVGSAATGYAQNLVFHKNAFALVTRPLAMPEGVAFKAQENWKGLSVRVVKDYDINTDKEIIRLDILYGVRTIYADLATRLSGTP